MKKEDNNLDSVQKEFLKGYIERMEKEGLVVPKELSPCKSQHT